MSITFGKGLRYADGNGIYIFGYELPNYLSQIVGEDQVFPVSIINPTTTFDLSNLPINNEVIVVLFENDRDFDASESHTIRFEWYNNRQNKLLFTSYSTRAGDGPGYYWPTGDYQKSAWIGYCNAESLRPWPHLAGIEEITENGSHRVEITLTGGINETETAYFDITGIPVQTNFILPKNNASISTNSLKITLEGFGGDGVEYISVYNSTLGTEKVYPSTLMTDSFTITIDISSLPNGNHNFTARAYDINGNSSDQKTITIIKSNRPDDWVWEFIISSGSSFYEQSLYAKNIYLMRAAHWNSFTSRINGFREYKGLSSYSFTSASTSTTEVGIRNCINQAIDAINSMLPSYQKMNNVYSGDDVSASIFTNMRDKLNSIS